MRECLVHTVSHPSYPLLQRSGPGDDPTQLEGCLWVLSSPHALHTMCTKFLGQSWFFVWCFCFLLFNECLHCLIIKLLHCCIVPLFCIPCASCNINIYLYYCYTHKWSFIMYSPGLTRLCRIGVVKRHNSRESPPKLLLPEVEFELVIHKVMHSEVEWTVPLPILWVCHKFWKSLEIARCSNKVNPELKWLLPSSYGNERSLHLLVEECAMKSEVCMIKSLSP